MSATPLDLPADRFGGQPSPLPAIGMAHWFTGRACRSPERPALSFEGETWSYGRLLAEIERLASVLDAGGVRPGMRVGYLGFNHPAFLLALFASARLGAVFVPLNFRLTGAELAYIANDAGIHTLLVDGEHLATIDPVRDTLCCARYLCVEGEAADPARWPPLAAAMDAAAPWAQAPVPVASDDVAVLLYTSGTTGRPKGAMLTHGNFWWNHVGELYTVDVLADDVLLVFAPLFHIGGLNVLLMTTLLKGGHVVLHRHFDPARVLADIAAYRVRTLFAVPAMLLFISQHPGFADAPLDHVRQIVCGGAPCPEPLLRTYAARGIAVQQGYGLTETAALVTVLTAEHALARIGSVGHTALLIQIRLVDPQGNTVSAPHARGEICVRGPNVTRGYWNQPEATRAAIDADGWFRTGDVGYADEDGFYYVCDRVKDMIISGGENVYPAEVESVLYGHPAVAEAAVIGAPDPRWGETVMAVVALKPGHALTLEALQDFAGTRLARYKIPRRLELVPALPRNPTGKILKFQLRETFAQG